MVRIQVPPAYDSDASITQPELKSYLGTGLIIDQIVQADLYPGTAGLISSTGAPSVDPNAGWYDPAVANGATRLLALYHGGKTRPVGIPWGYSTWASLPATGDIDERYLVTDLQVVVHYRTQAVDEIIAGAGNGLAGWHPISSGYRLGVNGSGGVINQGEVVGAVAGANRQVSKATGEKTILVSGVAMHTVAAGLPIIYAVPGCPDVVQVKVNPALTVGGGPCAINFVGEMLVVGTTAGIARSVGLPGSSTGGYPYGAFALTLGTLSAIDPISLVPCHMLGAVGVGRRQQVTRGVSISDLTPAVGAYTAFYPSKLSSDLGAGDNGAQPAAVEGQLADNKHAPIKTATIEWEATLDDGVNNREAQLELTGSGASAQAMLLNKRYGSNPQHFIERATVDCTAAGQVYYKYSEPLGSYATHTLWKLWLTNYTY